MKSISSKIIILILVLTVLPLSIMSYIALENLDGLEKAAVSNIESINAKMVKDSTEALNNLGKEMIKLRALDVAKQVEIYLKSHPTMTVADLQKDSYFQSIAVQPVGKTGYTALTDVDTLTCRFHISEKIVNLDLHKLADKLPGFWSVMAPTQGGKVSEGYYDWQEPDGSMRQKYMYIAIVDAKTADGVTFSVAATTYIDEFNAPVRKMESQLSKIISDVTGSIQFVAEKIKSEIIMFILSTALVGVIAGILFTSGIIKPLKKLTEAGRAIAEGKLDTKLPEITSEDEIKDLSDTMELMIGAIKYMKKENQKKASAKKKKKTTRTKKKK